MARRTEIEFPLAESLSFGQPPPNIHERAQVRADHFAEVRAALMAHPREWAMVAKREGGSLQAGNLRAYLPEDEYEMTSRKIEGWTFLYARYMPKAD